MKVSCFNCKYFIKTVTHNKPSCIENTKSISPSKLVTSINWDEVNKKIYNENNISKDDLLLCSKIGFRIFDNKNPNIYCNFFNPIKEPTNIENNIIVNKKENIKLIKRRLESNLYWNKYA